MAGRLTGKVALITGGGGIGATTAELFVAEGASVALVGPAADAVAAATARIDPSGARVLGIVADPGREPEAARMVRETVVQFGRLNVGAGFRVSGG